MLNEPIEEIGFVIGNFGKDTEDNLIRIAEKAGAKGKIYYQDEPLGTAHAIYCAEELLKDHVIIAFADTLFYADFKIDTSRDGILWTHRIPDPSSFGVVETNDNGAVVKLWEKPKTFISDEAIIGIYYVKNGERLKDEIKYLIDHNITGKGEYQLTDALERLVDKGADFGTAPVTHWLDCGNKVATLDTNRVILQLNKDKDLISKEASIENSVIIQPCFIDKNVTIRNAVIGPYVSVSKGSTIENSVVSNAIIMRSARVSNACIEEAMLGSHAVFTGHSEKPNLGDYSEVG
jgi:glucose-1-phosphate thymidylyltransferase